MSMPPLLRSRKRYKLGDIKIGAYKGRDWEYLNVKYQLHPQFVLGRSRRRLKGPPQLDNPINHEVYSPESSPKNNVYRRQLKPAVFRHYNLSQISTLPGAVLVEENKIRDDTNKYDRRKYVKNKNPCFINKLINDYESNIEFIPGSKNGENKFWRSKSCNNLNVIRQESIKENENNPEKNEAETKETKEVKDIIKDEKIETKDNKIEKNEENFERIKVNLKIKNKDDKNDKNDKNL